MIVPLQVFGAFSTCGGTASTALSEKGSMSQSAKAGDSREIDAVVSKGRAEALAHELRPVWSGPARLDFD
jgi:hypothetical protein